MRGNCCICLTKLVEGNKNAFAITCGHVFHLKCIQTWMNGQDTCPSCRMKVSKYQLIKLNWDEVGSHDERDEVYKRNEALTTSITALSRQLKTKNEKFQKLESKIRKVSVNMSSIAYNNQQLKHRNEELKEIVGEISVRRHFSNGAKVVFNEKDMMIEKMRLALKVLRRKIRQEDSDRCECEYDADADDEDEDDNEGSNQLSYNELLALNLPLGFYGTTPSSYLLDSSNGASLTDDDIANNGRDVDDDIEIEEPVSLPVYQNQDPQEANPCQPSTSTGIVYHMFEYETAFY